MNIIWPTDEIVECNANTKELKEDPTKGITINTTNGRIKNGKKEKNQDNSR